MKKQEVLPEYSITFKVVFAANNSIRHIRMSSIHTLYNLHETIYEVSGFFEKEHMHMFFMNNKAWSNDDAYDGAWNNNVKLQRSDKNVMLSQLNLYIGKKFLYIFDLGDCWRFRITVIGIDMEHTEKPEIVYSKGRELTQYP